MIAIIDLEMGNVNSVQKALRFIGHDSKLTQNKEEILGATKVVFPGVGSFAEASSRLTQLDLRGVIQEVAVVQRKPFFGICLGMQLLSQYGTEGGVRTAGLGLIEAEVLPLRRHNLDMVLPHVGWNDVHFEVGVSRIYNKINNGTCFYFVHSYEMVLNESVRIATTEYYTPIVASVEKGNIFGSQFHPEKSQRTGLQMLRNFCEL